MIDDDLQKVRAQMEETAFVNERICIQEISVVHPNWCDRFVKHSAAPNHHVANKKLHLFVGIHAFWMGF